MRVGQPEPETFEPWPELRSLSKKYAHRGLQVILKLANIEVTPKKPGYADGAWHVEGQLDEHICATALTIFNNEDQLSMGACIA